MAVRNGWVLTDVEGLYLWDNVGSQRVDRAAGDGGGQYEDFHNPSSGAAAVLDLDIGVPWISAYVDTVRDQQFDLQWTRGSLLGIDTVVVVDFQLVGLEGSWGGRPYRISLAGRTPDVGIELINPRVAVDDRPDGVTIGMEKHTYPSDVYAGRSSPVPVTVFRGDGFYKVGSQSVGGGDVNPDPEGQTDNPGKYGRTMDPRLRFSVGVGQGYGVRIGRILMGRRYEFPENIAREYEIEYHDPVELDFESAVPGSYPTATAEPGWREARIRFIRIRESQWQALQGYWHLHRKRIPFWWCIDEDDPESQIYGRITEWDWSSWFKVSKDRWEINLDVTIQEVSR